MTLEQYQSLSDEEQRIVLKEATLVAGRENEEYRIQLFQLGGFYVEMFSNKAYPAFDKSRSFDSLDFLEPYLEQIIIAV